MGHQAYWILRKYWSRRRMVEKAGGYYEAAFKEDRGVNQGDPIHPAIFNVVVDGVVRHWVSVIMESAEERGGSRQKGRHKNALFYVDDGMVVSLDPRWIQGYFSTLVGMFDRVGLKTNTGKTVRIVCRPCQAAGTQLEAAYRRIMTGSGPLYLDMQRGRIQRKECGEEMALRFLVGHMQTQNGRPVEGKRHWESASLDEEPRTYMMAFNGWPSRPLGDRGTVLLRGVRDNQRQ